MSKIEEMSLEHYKDVMEYKYKTGLKMPNITSFKAGANAVLREIEKVLVAANEQYTTKQAKALNTEIYNKIQELKG